ncbi:DUF645 family protein, partial [Vibrio cholerae]|nr:DUF645 family protein [Vibrio cholerae]ELJ8661085.1 DUF645 family protein [Vibrio cholerae]
TSQLLAWDVCMFDVFA